MQNSKNILIFGGSGFIGGHLSRYILGNNLANNVFCADIVKPAIETPGINYIKCDVRNDIKINLDNIGTIYNLAAIHRIPGHRDIEYFETNIRGAENVCNFAEKAGVNSIVFTSSISPYGSSEELRTEESLPQPETPYGISKLIAEYIHKLWAEKDEGRKLTILRPGVVFGEGENGNFTRLYRSLCKRYFFYPGRKDTRKACIYVKDLVRAMHEMSISGQRFQIYNMCYEEPPTIEDIVKNISTITHTHLPGLVAPAYLLKNIANLIAFLYGLIGRTVGIHPDRVKKLMISTNISGQKLAESPYRLRYVLCDAIEDWYKDCNYQGLC